MLKARLDATMSGHRHFAATERNKRVFKAAIILAQAADQAQFASSVTNPAVASLAADLAKQQDARTGLPLSNLPTAQAELRAACGK